MSTKFHIGLALVLAGGVMSTGCVARAKVRATSGPGPGAPPPEPVHRPPPPDHTAPPPPDRPPPEPPPPARWHFDATGWTLLGEREVDGKLDKDVIQVGNEEGHWSRLIVVVEDSELEMHNVVVTFGNGRQIKPDVSHYFREGQRTRQIHLGEVPGGRRIKDIRFKYSNLPGGGKAKVVVYAKQSEPPPPKSTVLKAAEWDKGGWQLLGTRIVQGKKDRDVIPVKKADGPFTKLMVVVEDSDLEMHDMTVTLGNKKAFTPEVSHFFREDQRTRAIDLPGEARNIKKVEFRYGNLPGGGKAKVELWGHAP